MLKQIGCRIDKIKKNEMLPFLRSHEQQQLKYLHKRQFDGTLLPAQI